MEDIVEPPWTAEDVLLLLRAVEQVQSSLQDGMRKQDWQMVSEIMDTDYFYTAKHCAVRYKKHVQQQLSQRRVAQRKERLAIEQARQKQAAERDAAARRADWAKTQTKRRNAAAERDELVFSNLVSSKDTNELIAALTDLETSPAGRISTLYRNLARLRSNAEIWNPTVDVQVGKTLQSYSQIPELKFELDPDGAPKFLTLVKTIHGLFDVRVFSDECHGPSGVVLARRELGRAHPCVAQLLLFSVENIIRHIRCSDYDALHSPNLNFLQLLQDGNKSAQQALEVAKESDASGPLILQALVARALMLAFLSEVRVVSSWTCKHRFVEQMAHHVVKTVQTVALQEAARRIVSRNERSAALESWKCEQKRLDDLDLHALRRRMATLRQQYRAHKKRGRPGRISLKATKIAIDSLQLDIDHAKGTQKHPLHGDRPSLASPRRRTPRCRLPPIPVSDLPDAMLRTSTEGFREAFTFVEEARLICIPAGSETLLPLVLEAQARVEWSFCKAAAADLMPQPSQGLDAALILNAAVEHAHQAFQAMDANGRAKTLQAAEIAVLCSQIQSYRRHYGDMSDAVEWLGSAIEIYRVLGRGQDPMVNSLLARREHISMFAYN